MFVSGNVKAKQYNNNQIFSIFIKNVKRVPDGDGACF